MRDPKRIPVILEMLGNIWKKYPDMRLGQLIENVVDNPTVLYYIEDDRLIQSIESLYGGDIEHSKPNIQNTE
jgi:hypothetical protein